MTGRRRIAWGALALVVAALIQLTGPILGLPPLPYAHADDKGGGHGNDGSGGGSNGSGGSSGSGSSGSGSSGSGSSGSGSDNSGSGSSGSGSDDGGSSSDGSGDDDETGGPHHLPGRAAGGAGGDRGERQIVAHELVVVEQAPDFNHAAGALGFVILERRQLATLGVTVTRLRLPIGMAEPAGRQLLRQRFPGLVADYNDLYRPQGVLSLPPPDYPRRLIGWGAPATGCGAGRLIGLIDTAVDDRIAGLDPRHVRQRSFLQPGATPADPAHGTAIAAILAGQPTRESAGLLPGIGLRVAQIFSQDGSGDAAADALSFVTALDWLAAERVPVVNLSLAGQDNLLIELAVKRASAQGMLLVAAAGNGGPRAGPAYPAAYPTVLAVAAVDAHRNPDPSGNRGDYIAFAAPGSQVWSRSAEGGQFNSGSSFAAPFLAAALTAELMAGAPADRRTLEARLAASAIDLGQAGRDPVFGWGLLQARPTCAVANAAME